jgi:hypothetical protein
VPITRQKSPVFSIVSLPTDSVIVDHAVHMPPETKIDCATKKTCTYHLKRNMQLLQGILCLRVTMSFVCHQKPHSLQPNQIYGNLVTNIPKS